MEIDKVFSSDVDGVADNLFSAVKNSVSEIKAMQQRKAAENVQLVIQALKKIESDLQDKFDGVTTVIEKRVATIKDGRDGLDGRNGRDGKDGRPGRDGAPGARGPAGVPGTNGRDGEDGVSVTDARIDFDGSLIISLSSGREINVGEVVAPDLAEKIKVITNGGGTSQSVLDTLASLQAQITAISSLGAVNYRGTWNASSNSPIITSGNGTKGYYYVVSVAGSTNIDGQTLWGVGDWIIFNGTAWQKVDGGSTGDFTTINVADLSITNTATLDNAKYLRSKTSGGSNIRMLGITALDSAYIGPMDSGPSSLLVNVSPTSTSVEFYASGSERARITSAGLTLSGGTANGVAYLNGSKVLTTGSALQYDGSIFYVIGAGGQRTTDAASANGFEIVPGSTNNVLSYNRTSASYLDVRWRAGNQIWEVANTEQMRLTSTGLGIGTSSPGAKLGVAGNAIFSGSVPYIALSGSQTTTASYLQYTVATSQLDILSSGAIDFQTGGSSTSKMRLDASGNLGVGTTSPNTKLQVTSASPTIRIEESGAGAKRLDLSVNSSAEARIAAPQSGSVLIFDTVGSERARITSGGSFLVGATSAVASESFLVRQTTSAYVSRLANDSATAANCFGQFLWYSSAAPNGTGNQFLRCDDSAATRAEIRSNGGLANYSGNNVNLSDRREKTNFAPAKSYLDTICAIPVQTFNYIDQSEDDPGLTLGVVAQDVQAVAPELVMESNWGTEDNPKMRLSIYQTDLQYALMKAIQELKAEFDAYKATHP